MDRSEDKTDERTVFVQEVRGRPYSFSGPLRTARYLLLAPIVAFVIDPDPVQLGGFLMVLVGLAGANPRLSPLGGGCLPCLLFVAAGALIPWHPYLGLVLAAWTAVAWLVASIELRLRMEPYDVGVPG